MTYTFENKQEAYELEHQGKSYSLSSEEDGAKKLSSNTRKLVVTLCILVTEMCERLTYYSIMSGLVLFCTSHLDIKQTDATTLNQAFSGIAYIIPIIGGFISDSFAGRFKTIFGCSILYIIGTLLLPAAAVSYESWGWTALTVTAKRGLFITGLVLVAIGTGGIKANVGPFGAEQVETMGKDAVQVFFNWFYWVINVGALVAYAGVSYIQQNMSFAWGFFVPFISMIVAVIIFVSAKGYYVMAQPRGSILTTVAKIFSQGCCKSPPPANPKLPAGSEKKLLARAKESYGGGFEDHVVDGLISVIKVLPFCLLVIMYWTIYSQMSNTFFAQSERMDIRVGDGYLPAAALNVFNTISIIILIPIVDRGIYPCFEKLGKPLTYFRRMGIGMVLSVIAVVVAGIVEIYRKDGGEYHEQPLGNERFNASSMSVFVQVPQFALIGASEIFTAITTLEFAYSQAPVAMQGLLTGLFLAASGIGNWLSMAILAIVQAATKDDPWWGDEINDCKMEYLMFLLGGLMFLNFLIFCVVAHFTSYQDPATFVKADVDLQVDEKPHLNGEKIALEQP
jgi:peptide/histidine transporter 3/4